MDIDENFSQYLHMIQGQKKVLEKAKIRKGECPRDRKPRHLAYMQFMMVLMNTAAKKQDKQRNLMHSSFVPPAYLPCTTPLARLTPIAIKDLTLETHHRGKYLLLRAITPPNRMTGILVLVEDDCDDVIMLQLYQQDDDNVREATEIVDVGAILLVKEPYFKVMASGDYGLRVDHLSDVVHVNKHDSVVSNGWHPRIYEIEESVESYKAKGDSAIGEGKYWRAIREYSNALSQGPLPERSDLIKRNRSLAYLKTKQYDAALSDTGFPSFGAAPAEKALFRAAEALYHLRRFRESWDVLETLRKAFPGNPQASIALERAQSRYREQSTGDYNFKMLQREAKKSQSPQLDHATYIGPVEIKQASGKGRGLFVTKAVKAGDLLLCEKAFSHAYVSETGTSNSSTSLLINTETGRAFTGGQADLIKLTAQKLYCSPSVAPAFVTLHHGDYKPTNISAVDGTPIVDTFLIEQIMSLNVFGCPLSSLATHKDTIANRKTKSAAYHSCGIWTHASYINHSCMSNAHRSFIGDMMIVRATKDIESGTEITFWYQIPGNYTPKKMQEKLSNWGFACDCAICQDNKKHNAPAIAERRQLLEKLKQAAQLSTTRNIQYSKMNRLLKSLNETYSRPAHEVPRLALWDPQLMLTRWYIAHDRMSEAIESVQKVLTLLGFIVVGADSTPVAFRVVKWGTVIDHLVEAFLHAQTAFEASAAWEDAKMARLYAKSTYSILVGEDTSFEATYGKGN